MYKAIIFDFFDVVHADPFKAWLKKHNFSDPTPYLELMKELDRGKLPSKDLYQQFHEISGLPLKEIIEDNMHKPLLDPDMPDFIRRLGRHYKIGLISNAATEEIRPLLEEHGYEELFDYVMISGEIGLIKPEAAAFKHILSQLGSVTDETVFIDDSQTNVDAACALGIKAILFKSLPHLKRELAMIGVEAS